ncbi:HAMP domain-containing sensor histidine kinase [Paenibacillus sp. BR1-192]|uniref:HAMP domain-containing sensor histidine kinase n=1 Tax=Paenibacillus sp. BR1-192 TaxID=3032287 RepID=UPI00240D06F7|nr:HAMP domain-containing sensor histidine kinase [Paenibacillus sp. BR1-192]WFB55761.1 HAMP domain-containing sensor histidine kinase [Paenibacillus sp. BR1-192]
MKLRTWLLIAFLVLMLLPLGAGIILYNLIGKLDEQRSFADYMSASKEIATAEAHLQNPELFHFNFIPDEHELNALTSDALKIELFSSNGVHIYSSMVDREYTEFFQTNASLYGKLYEMQINPRSYVMKKPVFEDGELVGIYQITLARKEWREGVRHRTLWVACILGLFITALFFTILFLTRRKLIQPMRILTKQMRAFAMEEPLPETIHRGGEMGELMDRFGDMRRTIEASRKKLSKQQEEKAFMTAALSHDLKTPLTSIRAYAEELGTLGLTREESQDYLALIIGQADRMRHMLDDLNLYSSLESKVTKEKRVKVDSTEFLEMLLEGYDPLASVKNIHVESMLAVNGEMELDPQLIMRMMDNLISNAIRYTPEGGKLYLGGVSSDFEVPEWIFPPFKSAVQQQFNQTGRKVLLLIQNEGEHIPMEIQAMLYEPFYQGEASRNQAGSGSFGLGLTIAKMVIERHQGTIMLLSEAPYGTLVICELPISEKGE